MEQREQALRETQGRIKDRADRMIWITLQREGIHSYPAAASDPKLNTNDEYDVSFLAHPHRHMFHFRIAIEVFHNDREIEFIQFKRWLGNLYNDSTLELNHKSCEMIADDLYSQIAIRYHNRKVIIDVSEDNENGCSIEYNTKEPQWTVTT